MPIEPEQDPTYLSFQRALGFDDADLRAVTANRKAGLLRARQYRVPELANQLVAAEKGIDDNYLSRNAFSSGHRGLDRGVAENDNALQAGKEASAYTSANADLDAELARQLATNQRRLAEEGLSARSRLALENAAVQPAPAAAAPAAAAPQEYYAAQAPEAPRYSPSPAPQRAAFARPKSVAKSNASRIAAAWAASKGY